MAKSRKNKHRKPRVKNTRSTPRPANERGSGPIGAMTRWAKYFKRFQFVKLLPKDATPLDAKRFARSLEQTVRKRQVGVTKSDFESLAKGSVFKKEHFHEAGLPTYAVRSLTTLLGSGRIDREALHSAIAALIYGVPLVVASQDEFDRLQHLITVSLHIKKLDRCFEDLRRNGIFRIQESYLQAEKALLTLTDIDKNLARATTLKNNLRRQCELRRVWTERGMERWHKQLTPCAPDQRPNVGIIDLLPLIMLRLDSGEIHTITESLTTPLGVMCLGLCPVICLPDLAPKTAPKTKKRESIWKTSVSADNEDASE